MKKSDMYTDGYYWITPTHDWQNDADPKSGRIGKWIGSRSNNGIFIDQKTGEEFSAMYVHVRVPYQTAKAELASKWAAFDAETERLQKVRRMANVVMGSETYGPDNISELRNDVVTINAHAFEALLNTARRAQKSAK